MFTLRILRFFLTFTVTVKSFIKYSSTKKLLPTFPNVNNFRLYSDVPFKSSIISNSVRNHMDLISEIDNLDQPVKLEKGAGALLNNKIISILTNKKLSPDRKAEAIQKIMKINDKLFNHVHALTILQKCAKERLNPKAFINLDFFTEIFRRYALIENGQTLSSKEISSLLYSLSLFNEQTPGIEIFLQTVLRLLDAYVDSHSEQFTSQTIACSFYGLKNFSNKFVQIRLIIKKLIEKNKKYVILKESAGKNSFILSDIELSMTLYGFRNMDSCEEVEEALLFLSKIIGKSSVFEKDITISNCLNGLQSMSTFTPGVSAILNLLAPKIQGFSGDFGPKSFGAAVMGFRSLGSNTKEARTVLSLILSKANNTAVNNTSSIYNPASISSVLNGLKSMNDNTTEVKNILSFLTGQIESMDQDFDAKSLSNAIYGVNQMESGSKQAKKILSSLNDKIKTTTTPFETIDIGLTFYGLNNFPASKETKKIIAEMTQKMKSIGKMRKKDIALALYGIKSHHEDTISAELKDFFSVITEKLMINPEEKFNPQYLGMSMLGLQKQKSSSKEVQKLISALSARVDVLDGQAVGNVLYSLQKMNSESPAIRNFLLVLANRIEKSSFIMSSQELSNAFWGLQGMNSDFEEVRAIVSALTFKLTQAFQAAKNSPEGYLIFTAQGIGNSLCGLQSMSDEVPETLELLGLFPAIIMSSIEVMTPQDMGCALFGLQGFSSNSPEIKNVLAALAVRFSEIDLKFSGKDIGYCLSGMSNKDMQVPEVVAVVQELSLKIALSKYGSETDLQFVQSGKGIKVKIGETFEDQIEKMNKKIKK